MRPASPAAPAPAVRLDPRRRSDSAERLFRALQERIVGQPDAIARIVDTWQTVQSGLGAPGRPLANLLVLGPTGSGKTHTVEALAETLFQNPRALVKIDCGEFQHSHEIARLVGAPPGYLGHRDTRPALCQEALDAFRVPECDLSLVLFDEIEKASDALWRLLLGVLDKAALTLGDNRRVDFARAMIFLSGNLGAAQIQRLLLPACGFAPPPGAGVDSGARSRRIRETALGAARRRFPPELYNRLDAVLVYEPLGPAQLEQVLELELEAVRRLLLARAAAGDGPVTLCCSERARRRLLEVGCDARYGARALKRALERLVVHPLARLISTGQLGATDAAAVDWTGDAFSFTRVPVLVQCRPPLLRLAA